VTAYSIQIKASAQKEMDLLSDSLFARIDKRILRLANEPRPQGCRKLRGQKDIWRIRIGAHRVIYRIDDTTKTVSILRIAHRREVYD
jgi:mRNA interferase RelE/StbE